MWKKIFTNKKALSLIIVLIVVVVGVIVVLMWNADKDKKGNIDSETGTEHVDNKIIDDKDSETGLDETGEPADSIDGSGSWDKEDKQSESKGKTENSNKDSESQSDATNEEDQKDNNDNTVNSDDKKDDVDNMSSQDILVDDREWGHID